MTPIILACAYQAEPLYGSAAKKVTVPIGSPWCNCCRIRTHLKMIVEHETMLKELYQVYFQSPGMRTEINKKRKYCINTRIGQFNTNKKIHTKLK